MRIGNYVILSVLLVTKASASCSKEDCETGLSVGAGVASVCATVGSALCIFTGWATMGLSCAMGLACGVTAGVARAVREACRDCGPNGHVKLVLHRFFQKYALLKLCAFYG